MATVKKCDKCGTIGAENTFYTIINRKYHDIDSNEDYSRRERIAFDLCDKCAHDVVRFIDPNFNFNPNSIVFE